MKNKLLESLKIKMQEVSYDCGFFVSSSARPGIRKKILESSGALNAEAFMCSYPRSGNTWTRMLIAGLLDDSLTSVDLDIIDSLVPQNNTKFKTSSKKLVIKEHAPSFDIFNKVIYNVRDGRDCMISAFKYAVKAFGYESDFDTFLFDRTAHQYGFWHEHVQQAIRWAQVLPRRILFVRYEDLNKSPVQEVERIARFLGIKTSKIRIEEIVKMTSLDKVKKSATTDEKNVFKKHTLGEGGTNKWKSVFTREQLYRFEMMSYYQLKHFGYLLPAGGKR